MARGGNMIVTLVAQTKRFQDGLSDAAKRAQLFGSVVGSAMNAALGAIGLLVGSIAFFLPNFIKMGEEARKSELRLGNVAKQMGLFGEETDKVTTRISKYAEKLSFLTGVDDDLIRNSESILLTFKNIGVTANKMGGIFDRATKATIDLAAAGFGEAEQNAKQLGKALNDPITGVSALREAGITFTDAERDKIKVLVKSNNLLEAQDLILDAIETQVGGTAAATASASDKMSAKFESVLETLSGRLLPAVDTIADAFSRWLESPEGKKALNDMVEAFEDFGRWIQSPEGKKSIDDLIESLVIMATALNNVVGLMLQLALMTERAATATAELNEQANVFNEGGGGAGGRRFFGSNPGPAPAAPNPTVADRVTVNVNGITPTATVGRTVKQSLGNLGRYGR
jgi:hypothetical protein